MKRSTDGSLISFVALLSFAIAACSGAGADALVTVGIRPTGGAAAPSGAAAGAAGGLPVPGSDVMMNQTLDAGSAGGAAGSSARPAANAGSGTAGTAPDAGMSGAADAGPGSGGAGGSFGPNEDECGAIPPEPAGNVSSGRASAAGLIGYEVRTPNVFVGLRTTLTVPAKPPPDGQIFIWPGFQPRPSVTNLQPIGNGALMTVLAWGRSCPKGAPAGYSTWWVAPMYSNISSSDPQYSGCHSGEVLLADPEQLLDIEIRPDGTTWIQKVVNRDTSNTSEFSIDLNGQAQGRVFFDIELQTSNKPTEDVIFTNTVLSMDISDPDACEPVLRGTNDFASRPRVSSDGKHCCIDRIVLRAPGVSATTEDPP